MTNWNIVSLARIGNNDKLINGRQYNNNSDFVHTFNERLCNSMY